MGSSLPAGEWGLYSPQWVSVRVMHRRDRTRLFPLTLTFCGSKREWGETTAMSGSCYVLGDINAPPVVSLTEPSPVTGRVREG